MKRLNSATASLKAILMAATILSLFVIAGCASKNDAPKVPDISQQTENGGLFSGSAVISGANTDFRPFIKKATGYIESGKYSGRELSRAYLVRAGCFYMSGEYRKAIPDLDKAMELNPADAEVYSIRGLSYGKLHNYEAAIRDSSKAIKLEPGNFSDYKNRANAYYFTRQFTKAIPDYEMAIKLEPDYHEPYNELAWILAAAPDDAARDGQKAVELALKALSMHKSPYYLDTLAAAYAESGDYSTAAKAQMSAIKHLRKTGASQAVLSECAERLELYMADKPYREK